jgi:uncharacterized delta-60 repeat protein
MGRRLCLAGVLAACGLAVLSAARATPGQLDAAFGSGGKVRTDIGGADWADTVATAPNGDVLVAGATGRDTYAERDVLVVRYDAEGRPDPSFGDHGIVVTDLGSDDLAGALVAQQDGKIVIAGKRGPDLALVRYSVDGTLDPTFDHDGVVVTDFGTEERALALMPRPSGRLVVVGWRPDGLVLARYLRDGRLDTAFGRAGTVVRRTPGIDWRSAAPGPSGTIVAAGARVTTAGAQALALAVARYRPDGRLDRTFGNQGLKVLSPRRHWAGAVHIVVCPDGRIVLGTHGHAGTTLAGFALVSLRRDGSLDPNFGSDGITVSPVGFGVHALGLDRRGRLVAAGRTTSLTDFVVARFLPHGRRDRGFATTVTDFGGVDTPFWLTLQRDGKIVVVGTSGNSSQLVGDIAVARYLASD